MKRLLYLCAGLAVITTITVSLNLPTLLNFMRVSKNLGSWRAIVYDDKRRVIGDGFLDLRVQDWRPRLGLHYPLLRIDPQIIMPAGKIRLSKRGVDILNSYGDSFSLEEYDLIHPRLEEESIDFLFSGGGSGDIGLTATLSGHVGTAAIYWFHHETGITIPVIADFSR